MLFYSNRGARRARASSLLLPGLWVSLILASVSANMPANQCPNQIDCTIMRRHLCKLGSSHCGPCLFPFEEDGAGLCVPRLRRHLQHHLQDKQTSIPNVDEEIDYLSSIMAKQEAAEVRRPDLRLQVSPPSQSNTTTPSSVKATTAGPPTQETSDASQPHSKVSDRHGPIVSPHSSGHNLLVLMVSFCILVGTLVLVLLGVCWVRFQRESHLAQKVDYPAFPPAPPVNNQAPSGDNTLAHSAQMYHYQHQKQQMLSMEKQKTQPSVSESGATSDEENEEGDFTVYECPGLAPTGEMEVKNPLFDDSTDSTRNLK